MNLSDVTTPEALREIQLAGLVNLLGGLNWQILERVFTQIGAPLPGRSQNAVLRVIAGLTDDQAARLSRELHDILDLPF